METEQIIKAISGISEAGAKFVIESYSKWFVVSSMVWILFGAVIAVFSFWIKMPKDIDDDFVVWCKAGRWAVLVIGLLIVCYNVATLFSPDGYAIHQIILDLKQ
jgi:hypothetical protein